MQRAVAVFKELSGFEEVVEFSGSLHHVEIGTPAQMGRRQIGWVFEIYRGHDLGQRIDGAAVKLSDALRLVGYHYRTLAAGVLRRHAGRATVGVAFACLYTA